MLIFCCGMHRSGSTLQYQIATEIIESNNLGISLGWIGIPNYEVLKTLSNISQRQDKFAVVKCHHYTTEAKSYLLEGKAKGIYIYRDLRDVIISFGNKLKNSVEETIESNCLSNCLNNYYRWTSLENVLISQYEQTTGNIAQEIAKIANFLGIELEQERVLEIADSLSLEQQKQKIDHFDYQKDGIENLEIKTSEKDFYDPVSQLHNQHIRSGKHGQWKTELSTEQLSYIENHAFSWLVDRQYNLSTITLEAIHRKTAAEYYEIGREYSKKREFSLAISKFQQAIILSPNKPLYHFQLGLALFKSERFLEAANAYRHAIYLNPQSALYYFRLGATFCKLELFESAIEVYRKAIKLEPNNPYYYSCLAEVFIVTNQPHKAIMNLKKVIGLNQINN